MSQTIRLVVKPINKFILTCDFLFNSNSGFNLLLRVIKEDANYANRI